MQQDSDHPTGVSDDSPRGGSAVSRARERKALAALELRRAGGNWDEIAQVLGYPTGRAALVSTEQTLEKQLKTEEGTAFMRKLAGDRLDRMLRGIWKKAIDENSPDQFAAIDRARGIIGDQRRLYGLDAPTEMVVHNPSLSEIEKWVAEVTSARAPQVEEGDIFDVDFYEEGDGPDALPAE